MLWFKLLSRIFSLFLTAVLLFSGCRSGKSDLPAAEELKADLQKVEKLTLAEADIHKVIILKDPDIHLKDVGSVKNMLKWAEEKIKPGVRTAVFSFDSQLAAFIDLSRLTEEDIVIDRKKKRCRMVLPPIMFELLGRDFTMQLDYQRITAYRSPVTPQERAELKNRAYKRLEKEVAQNPALHEQLRSRAEDRARIWLTELLAMKGLTAEISFKQEKSSVKP
ncbi:hypothetical protein HR11_08885 [Porphyromonas macacae]|uniref:DUF4230 domain-containing protein n=1 Tax=Porphyromonas macacae TaxID=28115 RepID=A0A379E7C3_9PORP|nr:DUF4230 domain-containing protein [Porphyromonas macacae]KGN98634.1 hypothetical protein HR11_08885 [Porphyromonas macacae]SUB88232.1 Uncharacterised protein [Porphyromonas macacae]